MSFLQSVTVILWIDEWLCAGSCSDFETVFSARRALRRRCCFLQPYSQPPHSGAMVKLTEYELQREARIAQNKALMAELGLDDKQNTFLVSKKTQQKESTKKKESASKRKVLRGSNTKENEDGDGERPAKAARAVDENGGTLRRSSRNTGKTVDYNAEQDRSANSFRIKRTLIEMEGEVRDANKRVHNPSVFRFLLSE